MMIKDLYHMPRMEYIDSLGDKKEFTTFDTYNGYWKVSIARQDRHKKSFICHNGTYQYVRMPFGLTNAPDTNQRALDMVLTKFKC